MSCDVRGSSAIHEDMVRVGEEETVLVHFQSHPGLVQRGGSTSDTACQDMVRVDEHEDSAVALSKSCQIVSKRKEYFEYGP